MTKFLENKKVIHKFTKPIVVFYHGDCTDGFTAAWVAWKKFGNKAEYIAQSYSDPVPELKNKEIYTLDFTFEKPGATEKLIKQNKRVTSIDHHVSNKDIALSTYKPLYALHHSGCTLAWKYFFPEKPVPKFLLVVEDVDLWKNKIKDNTKLYSYLDLFDLNFETYSSLISDFEITAKRKKMLELGGIIDKYKAKMIASHIDKYAHLVKFSGYEVYAINSVDFASEIGAKIYKQSPPFAIIWKVDKNGGVAVSLRGDGSVNVSKIAAKYGGGGHHNSSAFRLESLKDIPWKNI